jgi:hypothetical protein
MTTIFKAITQTVSTLEEAIAAAKELGNDIFSGYTNEIASQKRANASLAVTEYHLTADGDILYVCSAAGEKMLNKVSLGATLTSAPLCLVNYIEGEGFFFCVETKVAKGDREARRKACKLGFILASPALAEPRRIYA